MGGLARPHVIGDAHPRQRIRRGKGGLHQDPSQNPGQVPDWLDETIIPIPEIEEFKKQLRETGMR